MTFPAHGMVPLDVSHKRHIHIYEQRLYRFILPYLQTALSEGDAILFGALSVILFNSI
jgi:hypothetical protein